MIETRIGDLLGAEIDSYLSSREVNALPMNDFFTQRIKIKDLFNKIIPLEPNSIQLQHQKTKESYVKRGLKPHFLLLKYRRGGFTTWEQAASYRATVSMSNVTCATVADTQKNTQAIFRMVILMLRLDYRLNLRITESSSHIGCPDLGSFFDIGTAGSKAFTRGDNLYRFHGSEVAWWDGSIEDIDNLAAGFTEAAREGEVVLETTANGARGWFYENFKEAIAGQNKWIPLFYPWFSDERNIIVPTPETTVKFLDTAGDEEKEVMEKYALTIPQMLWRRDKKFERKRLFQQEYPETWEQAFVVRGNTFFDLATLDALSLSVKEPIYEGSNVTKWEKPLPENKYVAGADCADENTGNSDYSVCGMLNKKTGEQAAVLRGKWRPEVFARKAIELCREYNDAMFACEVNNHGHSVLNTVMNTLLYKNLYYYEKTIERDKFGKPRKEKRPGFLTNAHSRPILLDELNEALEQGHMGVNDRSFLADCKTFIDTGTRAEASEGEHDDTIFAWGIAWQARKTLERNFNIV
jgi:hypothetical protein